MTDVIITYQQTLEDVLIFLFFGIGAKVIMLFVFQSKKPVVPVGRTRLWYGLGLFWFLSAILQIWPTMAIASLHALKPHPLLWNLASYWARHTVANTIWSIIIQLILGILLLTERENLTGRIALGVSAIWSLFLWSAGESWGGLTHRSASLVLGSPGAGILAFIASAALLMPVSSWSNHQVPRILSRGLIGIWSIGTIWQVIHFDAYNAWSPIWIPYIDKAQPTVTLLMRHSAQLIIHSQPLLFNVILSALMAFAVILMLRQRYDGLFWGIISIDLLLFWWIGQGFGLRPAYGANLNAAPLLFLLIWSIASTAAKTHPEQYVVEQPAASA